MAWRRLASGASMAAHLRRGVPSPSFAPARAFSAASPTLPARHALQGIWSRCSSSAPGFQARAPMLRALLAARVSPGVRPKLPGLLRGFGTGGTAIAVMLYPTKVAEAQERPAKSPSEDITVLSPYSKQVLRKFWNLVRKFQLPIGLILLIVYGWRKPMVLAINTLLLLYSTRPDPYSIYLFLQEIHQGKVQQNPALWKEEVIQTRKVDTEDYKFFSIGTVELKDRTVLHVIGILGNWWIYHVSYDKRVEQLYL
ncbi:hypothetical protein CFC21_046040 [Triticum aestivum]|uniref:Uncharacterized protein n=2 Tax=Triticum aestivum TaxID=4565 RepID=A0A3B6GRR8_WHEAT|nr:uncharacterized protein LOC109756828 [Aegilops tauschii subsp. strangulata]XP_044355456.1 uncharacterized protein LOC123077275 [Triticum aestivum]KAF7035120.1 hypothetical protein CFC21_046040 [Triticum aestivum]